VPWPSADWNYWAGVCNVGAGDGNIDAEQAQNSFQLNPLCGTHVQTHWHHGDVFLRR
jgi:hypothetical protein